MARKKTSKAAPKTPNIRHWLTHKLRRASYAWPPRKDAIKNARVARGQYKCATCENIFGPKQIQLDHTMPVIDPHQGFTTWDDYINRLFCAEAGFNVMCKGCHSVKTQFENEIRKQVKSKDFEDKDNGDI